MESLTSLPLRTMERGASFCLLTACLFMAFNICLPAHAHAWPTTGQWIPVYKSGVILQDPSGDASGSRNVVSDATHDAAFIFNDGTYINFRLRLDKTPAGTGGQGLLEAFGWGVAFDTNQNPGNYEWLFMVDGVSQIETIDLWQNTVQGTLGDASDKPEILQGTVTLSGNYQITAADTAINGDTDYFLDWRFPYATFKQITGLTDYSPIRLFFGSSSSANNISKSGADIVGGSDLYTAFADTVTNLGTTPTTGTVKFVADLAGNGSVTQILPGDTIYIRVTDNDVNYNNATLQTVTVTLSASSGDNAVVTLTETGVNTGIFTALISSREAAAVAGDGILQVMPGDAVSAVYIDGLDASNNMNQIRATSLNVISLKPIITLLKSADHSSGPPGTEVIYSIHYKNLGAGPASNLIITDTIPAHTAYVTGSLRMGGGGSTYASAAALTDASDIDAGAVSGTDITFIISSVAKDDGATDSGPDEGISYFKVKID